ncbi:MAG: lactate utilization protein [Dysgonamonadaceae bacterium]|jgi:L-lactate dehydrogenase complex protein LldG|nr:lactate utilization protein [Dysgonamonadaceae bacterium]
METGKSKIGILQSIRKRKTLFPAFAGMTDCTFSDQSSPAELAEIFKKNLQAAGADIVELKTDAVEEYIASTLNVALDFRQPEIIAEYPADCPLSKLNKIEQAIVQGNFGVAENGAIWVEEKDIPHRIIPFITQHLILLLDARMLVATMQNAYQRICLNETGFGVFISGPSKTADIEQSLVYGAHGAKELTVLVNG